MNKLYTGIVGLVVVVLLGVGYVVSQPKSPLGAVASPDILSPYFSFGGVRHWGGKMSMRSASTTCSIQAPAATSTLVAASARFDSVPTGATTWELGVSSSAYATTTVIGRLALGSGAQGQLVATTTATAPVDSIIQPNQYVNLKVATGTAVYSGWSPVGECVAVFREI